MGIGFGATASFKDKNGRAIQRAAALAAIQKAVEDSCDDPFLASLIHFGQHEHELAVVLHPSAEAVFFTWDPSGTISVEAKTSTTGPGYHAYAVDVVRAVGERCGLRWNWEDETEFALNGRFDELQDAMASFLQTLANAFLDRSRPSGAMPFAVNMPINPPLPLNEKSFSITPLGPRDLASWESLARGDRQRALAAEFYPWWNRERDASFFHKTGLGLLWTEVRWHPPTNDAQEAIMQLAMDCFGRAHELDASLPVPSAELEELQRLLDMDEEDELLLPTPGLIGYHREVITRALPGGWSVELPGYWIEEADEETETPYFWHTKGTVRIATYGLNLEPGEAPPTPDEIAIFENDAAPDDAKNIEFRGDGLVGRGAIWQETEEGEEYFVAQAKIGAHATLALITITFAEPSEQEWALEVMRTVRPPAQVDE